MTLNNAHEDEPNISDPRMVAEPCVLNRGTDIDGAFDRCINRVFVSATVSATKLSGIPK
jgi:hypothetical protein